MADCFVELKKLFPDIDEDVIKMVVNEVTTIRTRSRMSLADKRTKMKELVESGKAHQAHKLKTEIADEVAINAATESALSGRRPNVRKGLLGLFESSEANEKTVDGLRRSNFEIIMSMMHIGLAERGLTRAAVSGAYDLPVYKVMFDGVPHKSADADEDRIINGLAEVYKAVNERQRRMMNDSGASIFKRNDFVHSQLHNGGRMRVTGNIEEDFKLWQADLLEALDMEKSFGSLKNPDGTLDAKRFEKELFEDFKRFWDRHDAVNGYSVSEDLDKIVTGNNLIDRLNKGRTYHFKDGEKFFEYNQKYGREGNLLQTLTHAYNKSSKTAAMMEIFGPSAQKNYRKVVDRVLGRSGLTDVERRPIAEDARRAFHVATGRGEFGIDNTLAKVGKALRTHQVLTKLGRAALSAGMDIVPTIMATKTATGDNIVVASLRSLHQFAVSIPKSKRSAVGKELLTASDAFKNELKEALIGTNYAPGKMSRMVDLMFNLSGVNFVTDVARKANGRLAMNDLMSIASATKHTTEMTNTINRHGFTPEDLKFIRENDISSPRHLLEMDLEGTGLSPEARDALLGKVHVMVNQRVSRGSPLPDARTKRILHQYEEAGTAHGEAARYFAQFKSTLMKITQDTEFFMRSVSHDGKLMNRQSAAAAAQYLALATAAGMFRNLVLEVMKDPENFDLEEYLTNTDNYVKGAADGGGLALMGDIIAPVFQDKSWSHMAQVTGTFFAGPVGVTAFRGITEARDAITAGPDEGTANFIVQQIPYQNIIFFMNANKALAEMLGNTF